MRKRKDIHLKSKGTSMVKGKAGQDLLVNNIKKKAKLTILEAKYNSR